MTSGMGGPGDRDKRPDTIPPVSGRTFRRSSQLFYVGDVIERLPWERSNVLTHVRAPWRITQVHPFLKVDPV